MADYSDAELAQERKGINQRHRQTNIQKSIPGIRTSTLAEILSTDFPPLRHLVEGLILEGFTVFAAPSKTGKTFFCYQLAAAVEQGGSFLGRLRCEKAEVLYLHLEGGSRSIKSRALLAKMPALYGVHFAQEWKLGYDALKDLKQWLDAHNECGLVIVDTFARVRKPASGGPDYATEYPEYSAWRELAEERRIAIVAVTHTRKSLDEGNDFVNESYGSGALGAVANGIIQIRRSRGAGNAILKATFRDSAELEAVLRFDGNHGRWEWTDENPQGTRQTPERNNIIKVVGELGESGETASPAAVAGKLGKDAGVVSKQMIKLTNDGILIKNGFGKFGMPPKSDSPISPNSPAARRTVPVGNSNDSTDDENQELQIY